MSTHSNSSYGSMSRSTRSSFSKIPQQQSNSKIFNSNRIDAQPNGSQSVRQVQSNGNAFGYRGTNKQPARSAQKASIMTRNRVVKAPTATATEDSVTVNISVVGVKFKCLVDNDWTCETLVGTAMAKYHRTYPQTEIPDCNLMYHSTRKEYIPPKDTIGRWCSEAILSEIIVNFKAKCDNSVF